MKNNNSRAFWVIQVSAWSILGISQFTIQHMFITNLKIVVLNAICIAVGGFVSTTLYRYYLKRNPEKIQAKGNRLIAFTFLSSLVLSILWYFLDLAIYLPFCKDPFHTAKAIIPSLANQYIMILIWNLFYLVYHVIIISHQTEIEKWQLAAEMEKAQLGALRSQINPHFMFNTLNNIRALILEDPQQARLMLTQFSEIMRYSLQYAELTEVTLEEELDMLHRYLDLLRIQYESRLEYQEEIDPATMACGLPPMILQLLMENAVKHGIALLPQGGNISLQTSSSPSQFDIELSNTGSLNSAGSLEDGLGLGLKNIARRLELIYAGKAGLTITEQKQRVIVHIQIPRL